MNRNDVTWRGYWPAAPTPFTHEGGLDEEALGQLMHRYVHDHMHGVLINGSSGEWFSQTLDERRRVAEIAVATLANALPAVIGCSALRLEESIHLASHAEQIGAAGVMLTPPPYARPSGDEIVNFFERVADATGLPILVYNIPRRVGVELDLPTTLRLVALERVVALKDELPADQFFERLPHLVNEVRVFGTHFTTPIGMAVLERVGGDGYIGGWEVLGADLPAFFEAIWEGDQPRADAIAARERALDAELWDSLRRPRFGRSFQSQLKAALRLVGIPAGYPRAPLLDLEREELVRLRELLAASGLPVVESEQIAV